MWCRTMKSPKMDEDFFDRIGPNVIYWRPRSAMFCYEIGEKSFWDDNKRFLAFMSYSSLRITLEYFDFI